MSICEDAAKKTNKVESINETDKKLKKKLEDLSWDQMDEMKETREGCDEFVRIIEDFRDRYEAEKLEMSQEAYQNYKIARKRYKEEQEAKGKNGNAEQVILPDVYKKAIDALHDFNNEDQISASKLMSKAKKQELKDISDKNREIIKRLKEVRNDVSNEKNSIFSEITKMNFDGNKEKSPIEYQKLCDQYYKIEELENKLDYAVVKMDMNNYDIAQATGIEYRNSGKKLEESEIDKIFDRAERILHDGVTDNTSIMDAYYIGEKLEYDVLPSLDGQVRELDSRINLFKCSQENYLKECNCTHEEAMDHLNSKYLCNEQDIQSSEVEKNRIIAKMIDAVEKSTALRDRVPIAESDCMLKVIENKDGTVTIERSWDNGVSKYSGSIDEFYSSEITTYRNAIDRKDSITLGQNSGSVYSHLFSFQYRGFGFKKEDCFGDEKKIKNVAEGGFLNFNTSVGYKRSTEEEKTMVRADTSGSIVQFMDTASLIVKNKEYKGFSTEVAMLKGSVSAKADSRGIVNVSASSNILSGEVSANVGRIKVAEIRGAIGEARASISTNFLETGVSAGMGEYRSSASPWDVLRTPKDLGGSDEDKRLVEITTSSTIGNGLTLASAKITDKDGEWKAVTVIDTVKKSIRAFFDGLRRKHLDIDTETINGIVKDVKTVQDIKNGKIGSDITKKSEEVVIGNSEICEKSPNDQSKY